MDITRHRKLGRKKSARTSGMRSKDSTNLRTSDYSYTLDDGRTVNVPPESKEVLALSDDDPVFLQWMDKKQEEWKEKHPNLTQEELDRKNDELIKKHEALRKKSKY